MNKKEVFADTQKYLSAQFKYSSNHYAKYNLEDLGTMSESYLKDMTCIKFLQNLLNAYDVNIKEFLPTIGDKDE